LENAGFWFVCLFERERCVERAEDDEGLLESEVYGEDVPVVFDNDVLEPLKPFEDPRPFINFYFK